MKKAELIENNPELESYLKPFKESKNYLLTTNGKCASVHVKLNGLNIDLSEKDLANLSNWEKIKKSGFSYINHCGFTFKDYGEICIAVFHPK